MACEDSPIARVWFRYGGQWDNVVSRNPPVSYALTPVGGEPGQCTDGYLVSMTFETWDVNRTQLLAVQTWGEQVWGPIGAVGLAPTTVTDTSGVEYQRDVPRMVHHGRTSRSRRADPQVVWFDSRARSYTLLSTEITRLNGPDNCGGPQRWRFTVTDATGQIYNRIEDDRPDVEIQCNDCPPGQVLLGDCCVDCEALKRELAAIQSKLRSL